MQDLTGFQRDLLYVIAGLDEPHGLAVKAEMEEYYTSEIHHGRLYPNLDTLVDKGLVEKEGVIEEFSWFAESALTN
ncbi:helix-turn-helix transcriptional regulator [Halobacterium salinarum]|uniref:helix-turn-helix transcriptional regulator n=1 Tax=Halobacterium salinarum TaxID=2242 RepID=UPI002552E395|nr:helix-turn-helix transcriptional regulator [Halobacterium salinarum]MDL0120058.1 helix-turn-helix transcriptional regulator [Halobacterium salinarum]